MKVLINGSTLCRCMCITSVVMFKSWTSKILRPALWGANFQNRSSLSSIHSVIFDGLKNPRTADVNAAEVDDDVYGGGGVFGRGGRPRPSSALRDGVAAPANRGRFGWVRERNVWTGPTVFERGVRRYRRGGGYCGYAASTTSPTMDDRVGRIGWKRLGGGVLPSLRGRRTSADCRWNALGRFRKQCGREDDGGGLTDQKIHQSVHKGKSRG